MRAVVCALLVVAAGMASARHMEVQSKLAPVQAIQTQQEYVRVNVDMGFCPHMCSGRGICVKNEDPLAPPENTAICICDKGWTGEDCSVVVLEPHARDDGNDCINNCSSHGVCYRGSSVTHSRCFCDQGYTGIDCSRLRSDIMICPNNCSGFGVCTAGFSARMGNIVASCLCDSTHTGEDCSKTISSGLCPNNCFGHGKCTTEGCTCDAGWFGNDCSMQALPSCTNGCSSRGRCSREGKCVCMQGYQGEDCSEPVKTECPKGGENGTTCSGNGRCVPATDWFEGGCQCKKGFKGKACQIDYRHDGENHNASGGKRLAGQNCPRYNDALCNSQGFCRQDDRCECYANWIGDACEFNNLDGWDNTAHPIFMPGRMLTENENKTGFVLSDADHPGCINNCSSHGVCHLIKGVETPVIDENGTISQVETNKMPQVTKIYACQCDTGYIGSDCSIGPPVDMGITAQTTTEHVLGGVAPSDPAEASLFTVDTIAWDHLPSITELAIRSFGCPLNCSSRGRCITNADGGKMCSCYTGWLGADCSRKAPPPSCPLDCVAGRCTRATEYFPMKCLCNPGYTGDLCDKPLPPKITYTGEPGMCPNQCSYRGPCVRQKCVCLDLSWGGPDCSIPAGGVCKDNCNGNGICYFGFCGCLGGYTGDTCAEAPKEAPCPNDCQMRGKCVGGTCMCLNGYTGDDCSDIVIKCPRGCSGHGTCNEADIPNMKPARCECASGWTGPDCANFPHTAEVTAPVINTDTNNSLAAQSNNEIMADEIEEYNAAAPLDNSEMTTAGDNQDGAPNATQMAQRAANVQLHQSALLRHTNV